MVQVTASEAHLKPVPLTKVYSAFSFENLEVSERTLSNSSNLREPLKFCKFVAKWPNLCFAVALGVHLLFVLVSAALMLSGYDLFPVDFESLPLDLRDSEWFKRDLAWRGKSDFKDEVHRYLPQEKDEEYWPRAKRFGNSLLVLYDAGAEGNIFTKEKLKVIQKIEETLAKVPGYKDYCQMTEAGTCIQFLSVLRLFDGSLRILDPVFDDPNFDNIIQVLHKAYTLNVTRGWFMFGLSKGHIINSTYVEVSRTRSIIPFGYPINGMDYMQSFDACLQFLYQDLLPVLESFLKTEEFTFLFYQEALMIKSAKKQGFDDMKLALGSSVFIFLFILFHTHSFWTTTLGVFSILCSFVETNLIYRVMLQYRYFGFFHVLVIFIILGIGADDLFVFWDAWKATKLHHFPTLAHRLDETYRKSALSMFVTSLTTMLAFLVSAISPLLATNSFGVFSAILVIIDYISVVTFFPTIVVFYHLHFENKSLLPHWCRGLTCCSCKKEDAVQIVISDSSRTCHNNNDDNDDQLLTDVTEDGRNPDTALRHQGSAVGEANTSIANTRTDAGSVRPMEGTQSSETHLNVPGTSGINPQACATTRSELAEQVTEPDSRCLRNKSGNSVKTRERKKSLQDPTEGTSSSSFSPDSAPDSMKKLLEHRWQVVFFRVYYYPFVTHRVWRWVVLVFLTAVMVVFAVFATRIRPDNKQVGLFRESHYYTRAFRLVSQGFADNSLDSSILLVLVWGVKERDLSSCSHSDYKCHGKEAFDDSFDPNTVAAQQSLMRLCDTLYNLTVEEANEMRIRRDINTGRLKIRCFTRDLDRFLKNDDKLSGVDVNLPWNRTTVENFVTSLRPFYNLSKFNASYKHYLDVPVNYWLWDGFRQSNTEDYYNYNNLFGEQKTPFSTPVDRLHGVVVGNRLKYITVAVSTSLRYETLSYVDHIPVVNRWEEFMQHQLSAMPPEMKSGFQITEVGWHWLFVQKNVVDNAVSGVVLGVTLALLILVIATLNIVNGLLATLTICCTTVCVVGVVPMAGWKLGVLVSLNMCLVVGLAVDYVVHLAEGYHMSNARDRKTRLRNALERMGISVLSGALTTMGASSFMLFSKIQFFFQFGIFMFCTIGFSLVFSLGFYTTLMGILGPEGDTGDIRILLCGCVRCVCGVFQMFTSKKVRPASEAGERNRNSNALETEEDDDDMIDV